MFWLDATEQNGTVYLIGKVAVPSTSASGEATTSYLSACVAVHGIEREVLVLPRCVSMRVFMCVFVCYGNVALV